jgi:ABC-2 type transport system ATP-binding protein
VTAWGLRDVSVDFHGNPALRGADVEVSPGSITVVVGGDGAGKTTACRALVGLERPTSGSVSRPDGFGFQPETSGVWRDLTVIENLMLVAGAYKVPDRDRRIDELVEVTDLGSARDRLGGELSGGMRQKLGVAMALLPSPDLLVLDEPTTGLDPLSRIELWSFIGRAAADGRAVLVTTTYMEEASRAGHIVALDQGRVLASGTLDDVIAAMPGHLYSVDHASGDHSWRRGGRWRLWSDDGRAPDHAAVLRPDLADVVTVASLREEGE